MEKELIPMPLFSVGEQVVGVRGRFLVLARIVKASQSLDWEDRRWKYELDDKSTFDEKDLTKYEQGGVIYL